MFVSAVVPVYNSVKTLERAINSLLIQPEINEIFIVDDGSTDDSYNLELKLESKYQIIKVLIHPERINKGASASRNLGLKLCSNEWIQFLDADDELLANKISSQIKIVDSEVPFVVGNCCYISGSNRKERLFFTDIWNGVLFTRLGDTCSNLWNKAHLSKAGFWDEKLINSQDYDLIFRILKLSDNIRFDNSIRTNIYKTSNSISTSKDNLENKLRNFIKCRTEVKRYLLNIGEFSVFRNFYYSAYVGTIIFNHPHFKFDVKYSLFLFYVFKVKKSISDRFL